MKPAAHFFILSAFFLFSSQIIAQVPNYVPAGNLELWMPFSGNPNDVSNNGNDATNNNAVLTTDRFGNAESAYSFNGTNAYMQVAAPSFILDPLAAFSFSAWINKQDATGVSLMVGSNAAGNFITLLGGATQTNFGTNKQQSAWVWAITPHNLNQWDHYVCVYDQGDMTLYKNNEAVATATFAYTNVTTANLPLFIGKDINTSFFTGKIDDIGFWSRALTPCEVGQLFNSAPSTTVTVDVTNPAPVCFGNTASITASGAVNYTWTPGNLTGATISVSPLQTTTYTVVGADANGCTNTNMATVTVLAPPTVGATASTDTVCSGSTVTLSGTGASTYVWDNGVTNGVPFAPTATTTYLVTGTDANDCENLATITVTVITCSDTDNETNAVLLSLFPNPAQEYLQLKADIALLGSGFSILNAAGQSVFTGVIESMDQVISLTDLPKGSYFFRVENAKGAVLAFTKQ